MDAGKRTLGRMAEGGNKMGPMLKRYIQENYDTGFLSPGINFALFCAAFALAVLGFIFGA